MGGGVDFDRLEIGLEQQVGILSEHALEFARLTEKRLGTSKFGNSIFERFKWVFDLVFSSNPVFSNLSNYWEG